MLGKSNNTGFFSILLLLPFACVSGRNHIISCLSLVAYTFGFGLFRLGKHIMWLIHSLFRSVLNNFAAV